MSYLFSVFFLQKSISGIRGTSFKSFEEGSMNVIRDCPIFPSVSNPNLRINDESGVESKYLAEVKFRTDGKMRAFRTQKDKEQNPDRLSLDKRSLTVLPMLLDETQLRLLSIQHNLLTKLDETALSVLLDLVFLDVYNNQLKEMQSLESLRNLRVLLLGKNRIKHVEGLTSMAHLEVLDLHGNHIMDMRGLQDLKNLKVLNLAGNTIKNIGLNDLRGLHSLHELNLRRNHIKTISGFAETQKLSKLFLSNNEISSVEDMKELCWLQNLDEIALDGNPVFSDNCTNFILSCLPTVQIYGRFKVTDEGRKSARIWHIRKKFPKSISFEMETSDVQKAHLVKHGRQTRSASENRKKSNEFTGVIRMSQSQSKGGNCAHVCWEKISSKFCKWNKIPPPEECKAQLLIDSIKLPPILSPWDSRMNKRDGIDLIVQKRKNVVISSSTSSSSSSNTSEAPKVAKSEVINHLKKKSRLPQKPQKRSNRHDKIREQGIDYSVEICGNYLNVSGKSSARYVDRAWNIGRANEVTKVRFSCVCLNSLVPVFGKIKKRFPSAEHFEFSECNLNLIGQLNALSDIQGLTSLMVDVKGNLIVNKPWWRSYAIYRLRHWGLQEINFVHITDEEIKFVEEEFRGLSEFILHSLPENILTPLLWKLHARAHGEEMNVKNVKDWWLCKANPQLREVICKEALQWRNPASLNTTELISQRKMEENLGRIAGSTFKYQKKLCNLELGFEPLVQSILGDFLSENKTKYRKELNLMMKSLKDN